MILKQDTDRSIVQISNNLDEETISAPIYGITGANLSQTPAYTTRLRVRG